MDLRQGVRTCGHDHFHCLTRAQVTKVNLWKSKKRQNLQEGSVCAENTLATTLLLVLKKRKRRSVDGTVWKWIWSCRQREKNGCRIHELFGNVGSVRYIAFFLLFTIYCSCALLYASYPHHSADALRCCFFVYKIRERERKKGI